ncbi:DNA cytosine methyltransferase [Bradyrhizobium diazoefficiens]|uniref:DNA cytosine methyltransferase n=1 Tax=Bradyrhizobium diazoefficiens TaxID=1355477 RepID=UPI00272C0EC3|nr:DNA cytosine methyltransferase [Bradyrhizobium diazoefficiens]WLA74066.1 DNA cytosine methyltransferase [Bradyrhizobium diazoefficiens]
MNRTAYTFVDLFAGCGGFSLGLFLAGLDGKFAVERDPMAFETLAANLCDQNPVQSFDWPDWLEKRPWSIEDLLSKHKKQLTALRRHVDVLAGGPPCQGFSFAGRRREGDPRNLLFMQYVEAVAAIQPSVVILENVPGMQVAHARNAPAKTSVRRATKSFYDKLAQRLEDIGYAVEARLVDASRFGVPQRRSRLIAIGVRSELAKRLDGGVARAFQLLEQARTLQLKEFKLPPSISAAEAISDLEVEGGFLRPCTDPTSKAGYLEIEYRQPLTRYQKLMHASCAAGAMDSMRLANHRKDVAKRFAKIIASCPQGIRMNDKSRAKFGLKKHRIFPMSSTDPAPTVTTLPDDVLHYSEPRILTVRECARLQSFPDWFEFRGKFTTGGNRRTKECPRYTQVGNAVPPYLGRAIGIATSVLLDEIAQSRRFDRNNQRSVAAAIA